MLEETEVNIIEMKLFLLLALVPLLAHAQEEEMSDTEEDREEADVVDDWWRDDQGPIPEYFDNSNRGVVSSAIYQGATCGSCGQVSGTQALEARIALVSENWVPYSIQNFMNCDGRVCIGSQPYRMATLVRANNWIVPRDELPYTKNSCRKWGEGKSGCNCGHKMGNYTNVLDDQFVFIGPTVPAHTEEELKHALQTGPAVTTYTRSGAKKLGAKCKNGGSHANSIIGYNKDSFIIQESYGKGWGNFKNGTWETLADDICGKAILSKAYFTVIFYDYDRANAYYSQVDVEESKLRYLVDTSLGFTEKDLSNIGLAKNRCAFMGEHCKGVYKATDGEIKLVSAVSKKGKKNKKGSKNMVTYFRKTQMVIYLKNEASNSYLTIAGKKYPKLGMTNSKKKYAPFFTSYGRIISYRNPEYHVVDNKLEKIEGDIKDSRIIDQSNTWALDDCNLKNAGSGESLDIVEDGVGGSPTDLDSESQRFSIGISGKWSLVSSELGKPLLKNKKTKAFTFIEASKTNEAKFRWNAQQITGSLGKPFNANFEQDAGYFEFSQDPRNAVTPTGCKLVKQADHASRLALVKKRKKYTFKMAHNVDEQFGERWTLERDQI